jgi:hypothetical protein
VLENPLQPVLLPDAAAWDARDVETDEPDNDARCPANLPPEP